MKFTVSDGLGILSIGLSEIGSYFRFEKPQSVVWYDCRGSVGKYFCSLPHHPETREKLNDIFTEGLYEDYTNKPEELKKIIFPLFRLLKNGEYTLNYYNSSEAKFFSYKTSTEASAETLYSHWYIDSAQPTILDDLDAKIAEHKEDVKERTKNGLLTSDILEYTTHSIYEGNDVAFIATQPKSSFDAERIKFFETEIAAGKRPFVLIFNRQQHYSTRYSNGTIFGDIYDSENYVLDGHHKLKAYENLKITPPIVEITHCSDPRVELDFDVEELCKYLFPWQVAHIVENWDEKDDYIEACLENPDSPLHPFIKNGNVEEYHNNGQLKHKAFYRNDWVVGTSKTWYENGQLQYEWYYKNKLRAGTWKNYYSNGSLQGVSSFNELGQHHGVTSSYYENGQKRSEIYYHNGVHSDDKPSKSWYENGQQETETYYRDGRVVLLMQWGTDGKLTESNGLD